MRTARTSSDWFLSTCSKRKTVPQCLFVCLFHHTPTSCGADQGQETDATVRQYMTLQPTRPHARWSASADKNVVSSIRLTAFEPGLIETLKVRCAERSRGLIEAFVGHRGTLSRFWAGHAWTPHCDVAGYSRWCASSQSPSAARYPSTNPGVVWVPDHRQRNRGSVCSQGRRVSATRREERRATSAILRGLADRRENVANGPTWRRRLLASTRKSHSRTVIDAAKRTHT